MFKKLKTLGMLSAATVLFAACGSQTAQNTTTTTQEQKIDYSQEIVIYSNSTANGRGDWLKEKAAEKGFKISYVDISGGELADRLIAEKNNAVADLVFGLNNLEFNRIKAEGLLEKYEPTWAKEVDATLGDKDGQFYPIVVQPLVLIGNAKATMPKDWTDLANESYKDTYGISKLSTGTSKNIFASIISRYKDEKGELGISKEGWEVAKKYIQNAHTYAQGEDYISAIIDDNNKLNYSMMWGSGVLQNEKERNYKFQVMKPEIGVPYVTEQIGFLKASKKQALVKEFINWFGSAEVQKQWSDKFGSMPANKVALDGANEKIKAFASSVKPQNLDWEFIGKNINSWVEKVELEFVR